MRVRDLFVSREFESLRYFSCTTLRVDGIHRSYLTIKTFVDDTRTCGKVVRENQVGGCARESSTIVFPTSKPIGTGSRRRKESRAPTKQPNNLIVGNYVHFSPSVLRIPLSLSLSVSLLCTSLSGSLRFVAALKEIAVVLNIGHARLGELPDSRAKGQTR